MGSTDPPPPADVASSTQTRAGGFKLGKRDVLQFARFLAIGVFNTFLGLGLIYFCMGVLGIQYAVATAIVFPIGIVVSFVLNRRVTFAHRGAWKKSFLPWLAVTLFGLACNLAVLELAVRVVGMNPYIAQLFGTGTSTIVIYLGGRIWAFAPMRSGGAGEGN